MRRLFLHALNYCMLLLGPEATQLATYLGWLMHGISGGLIAGGLFLAPSTLMLMALAAVRPNLLHPRPHLDSGGSSARWRTDPVRNNPVRSNLWRLDSHPIPLPLPLLAAAPGPNPAGVGIFNPADALLLALGLVVQIKWGWSVQQVIGDAAAAGLGWAELGQRLG